MRRSWIKKSGMWPTYHYAGIYFADVGWTVSLNTVTLKTGRAYADADTYRKSSLCAGAEDATLLSYWITNTMCTLCRRVRTS